jgi:hypothetical protein
MKYFFLYIVILCFIILTSSIFSLRDYFKSQESMETMSRNIILMGDSVLQNKLYVKEGETVEDKLKKMNPNLNIYNFARDNATIVDVYEQLNAVPIGLNDGSSVIFLSVGGNDFLTSYEYDNGDTIKTRDLEVMMNAYKKLIRSIEAKMNKTPIILFDIYYPTNLKYKRFKPLLEKWNKMLKDYVEKGKYRMLNVSELLVKPEDYTLSIEPSEIGGEKIAEKIIEFIG